MAWVNAKKLPTQNQVLTVDYPRLDGGLNLSEVEERLKPGESPEMENLWWEDGILESRPGQREVPIITNVSSVNGVSPGHGFAVTDKPFYGNVFLHIGSRVWRWDGTMDEQGRAVLLQAAANVPMNAGTFFRFGDCLFYKNKGGFFRFEYQSRHKTFRASSVAADPFVPTIAINADPATGAGDLYQPENRLTGKKRVTYNPAAVFDQNTQRTGDGSARIFAIGSNTSRGLHHVVVSVGGVEVDASEYDINLQTGYITFHTAPANGAAVILARYKNTSAYYLPVRAVDEVTEVKLNGVTLRENSDYTVNLVYGRVDFVHAPAVTNPPASNAVEIVYRKENRNSQTGSLDAYNAVMDCAYAAVYGAGTQLCIVLGGCPAQPNAVFWSGNNNLGLDPSYWPMSYYNLVGDTEDRVTGFGNQYGDLIVFKARSVGKLAFSAVDVDGRDSISLTWSRMNDAIGCDLPGSIRLVGNNLVFANTEGGVYRVRDTSAAYETGVEQISGKINGNAQRPGLLANMEDLGVSAASPRTAAPVSSFNDGQRYLLAVGGRVWAWDYSISDWKDPAWFPLTGFPSVAGWFRLKAGTGETYHIDGNGRLTRLTRVFDDYGAAFPRVYQFPLSWLGTYDRLKDVLTVLITLRGETPTSTDLIYATDYEKRSDLTPLSHSGDASISPRDLTYRDLTVNSCPVSFRRRPMCRHVRHFSMRLENKRAGQDLAVLYAQIQYRVLGRTR